MPTTPRNASGEPLPLQFIAARHDDAAACIALRGQTRENAVSAERLHAIGITVQSWGDDIRSGALPGYICFSQNRMVGYCFGARDTGEIVVLALLPAFESLGIGAKLLQLVVADLVRLGWRRLFLGCSKDPNSRSYGFYRHLGWRSTGRFDKYGDEVLEFVVGEQSA